MKTFFFALLCAVVGYCSAAHGAEFLTKPPEMVVLCSERSAARALINTWSVATEVPEKLTRVCDRVHAHTLKAAYLVEEFSTPAARVQVLRYEFQHNRRRVSLYGARILSRHIDVNKIAQAVSL
jgi:hypothetical protein